MSYQLTPQDRQALVRTASELGVSPYEFAAVLQRESGINPNRWGGAGGNYYGSIQFGGPERTEAGLDPNKIGSYTLAEQMPHVSKWLKGRGYKPGMGVGSMYATILGGNPNANRNAPDSFGSTINNSLYRFQPGGDDYEAAAKKLGDLSGLGQSLLGVGGGDDNPLGGMGYKFDDDGNITGLDPLAYIRSVTGGGTSGDTYNTVINLLNPQDKEGKFSILEGFKKNLLGQAIQDAQKGGKDSYDPMEILKQQGFLSPTGYLKYVNQ